MVFQRKKLIALGAKITDSMMIVMKVKTHLMLSTRQMMGLATEMKM